MNIHLVPGAAVAVASSCSTSAAMSSAAAGSAAFVVVAAVVVGVMLQLLRCLSGTPRKLTKNHEAVFYKESREDQELFVVPVSYTHLTLPTIYSV